MGRMSTEVVEEKGIGGCCSGGVAWGKREDQSTSVKSQMKTTVGDRLMCWRGKAEGLVCFHFASRLELSKANFDGMWSNLLGFFRLGRDVGDQGSCLEGESSCGL